MYNLKVKINNIWQNVDLYTNEQPAMNYQVNSLAELKDRQSTYSQEIKIPLTNRNKQIFSFLDVFYSVNTLPYKKLECRLYAKDVILAGKKSYLIVNSVQDIYLSCQILSGNADFFTLLEDRLCLNASFLGYVTVGDNDNLPSFCTVATCNNGKEIAEHYFLNLYDLAELFVKRTGFTLVTNLTEAQKQLFLSLKSLTPLYPDSVSMFDVLDTCYSAFSIRVANTGQLTLANIVETVQKDLANYTNYPGSISQGVSDTTSTSYIKSNINGKLQISIDFNATLTKANVNNCISYVRFAIIKGGQVYWEYSTQNNTALQVPIAINEVVEVEVTDGEQIHFVHGLYLRNSYPVGTGVMYQASLTDVAGTFKIEISEAEKVPENGRLYFQNNLSFNSYLDLIKAFVQTYGLTVQIDHSTNTAYAYTFDKIYQNKTNAKDFTKKFITNKSFTKTFTLDNYAQKNFLYFQQKDDLQNRGEFLVNNETLKNWTELFTLPYESGEDLNGVAIIPLYTYEQENNAYTFTALSSEHLVSISNNTARHIFPQYLIDTFYNKLFNNVLKDCKVIECYLYLYDLDILNLDFFTPIFLQNFGFYFYLMKVQNYISGKPTKCLLVRL